MTNMIFNAIALLIMAYAILALIVSAMPKSKRVHGYLPVVIINNGRTDKADRIASTIRHNRARGKHKVEAMSEIVLDLKKRNWSDARKEWNIFA